MAQSKGLNLTPLVRRLEKLSTGRELILAVQEAGDAIRAEARRLAPQGKTGVLRGSIQRVTHRNAVVGGVFFDYAVEVFVGAPYARAVEFGVPAQGVVKPKSAKVYSWKPASGERAAKMPRSPAGKVIFRSVDRGASRPHPFLQPAFNKVRRQVGPALRAAMRRILAGGRLTTVGVR